MKRIPDITKYKFVKGNWIYGKVRKQSQKDYASFMSQIVNSIRMQDLWIYDINNSKWIASGDTAPYFIKYILTEEKDHYTFYETDEQEINKIVFADAL